MASRLVLYPLLGLFLFIFQELILVPRVHLRLLPILVFYAALKDNLVPAGILALLVGLLLDSYALTPFGVNLMGAFVLVAAIRVLRQRFLIRTPWSLMCFMLLGLVLQEISTRLLLTLLGYHGALGENLSWSLGLEFIITAVSCPALFGLFRALEERWVGSPRPLSRPGAPW